jgi:hypothetical protein
MYRIVNRSFMHRVVIRLSAMFLVAALSLFAATVGSAAGSSGTVGKLAKHSARHKAKRPAPAGVVFGGVVTSDHAPVVIQASRDGREVVEATMAVPCLFSVPAPAPTPVTLLLPNSYTHLSISATGAFQGKYEKTESEGGNTQTGTGQVSGQFNRAMTTVTGTWSFAVVDHNAFGTTVAQCESGSVSFTAIQ